MAPQTPVQRMLISLHIDEQRGWRGGEQQASYLIKGLAASGYRVLIAGRQNAPFLERHQGLPNVQSFALPFCGEWDIYSAWQLARLARLHGVDILHAHTAHAHTMACMAKRLGARAKVVVTRRVDFAPRRNAFTNWKYRRADRVVCISQTITGILRGYGVEEDKLRVIHSAQDPGRLQATPIARSALGVPEDIPLLLCPAALVGHKDHATLIRALRTVVENIPDVHLLLAGEGPLRPEIEAQVSRLGLTGNVVFLGYRDDVPALMATADVFVLSSSMEGLGSTVIEAMFAGLPIVACAGGGIPEMVIHEETGLLSPTAAPDHLAGNILRMLGEPELAGALAGNARRLAEERFRVETMVADYEQVYAELSEA